jgi:hypothetical protein
MAAASVLLLGQTFFGAELPTIARTRVRFMADPLRICPATCCVRGICSRPSSGLRRLCQWCSVCSRIAREPVRQAVARNPPLFGALALVIVGSMFGEWVGILQWLPTTWFWLSNQGWEYLELGASGRFCRDRLVVLVFLVWRAVAPARRDPDRRGFANFFDRGVCDSALLFARTFYGSPTNYTIVDAWRFWIIHLWVEGFFEFFVTVSSPSSS